MAGDTSGEAPGLLSRVLPGFSQAPNLHPMFVHFPIVFFYAALFFAALSWYRRRSFFLALSRWMFWLGLGTLPLAAATGFWAVGGWGHEHVTVHRNLMLATTVLAVVLLGLTRWCSDRQRLYRIVLTAGLVVVTGVMTLGADRGAWLVFVQGSGVRSEGHVHQDDSGDRAAPTRSSSGTAPGDDRERSSDGDGQSLSDGTGSEHHDHDHPHP